jgi:hypothetical protein
MPEGVGDMNHVIELARAYPWPAVVAALVVLGLTVWTVVRIAKSIRSGLRRTPGAVVVTAFAAAGCTAYSADTSWRFAEHALGMVNTPERIGLFAAGELALLACALMARENIRQTSTEGRVGTPGTPGVLVWVITGVQVIPAFAEGGMVGGVVRAFFGPVAAALLWHLAMGIEIRHGQPGARSSSLPAIIGRELRERALSRLGLARRGRDAEQITRDRWTVKAVALAARLAALPDNARRRRGRVERRLSKAVARAQVGANVEQRARLLELLAARRHAAALATIELASPWQTETGTQAGTPADPVPGYARPRGYTPYPEPVPVPAAEDEKKQVSPNLISNEVGGRDPWIVSEPVNGHENAGDGPASPGPENGPEAPTDAHGAACPALPGHPFDFIERKAAKGRTRAEVRAGYAPEAEPVPVPADVPETGPQGPADDGGRVHPVPDVPDDADTPVPPVSGDAGTPPGPVPGDELTPRVRVDFAERLATGELPPFRALKDRYHINQDRARRIRDELDGGQS